MHRTAAEPCGRGGVGVRGLCEHDVVERQPAERSRRALGREPHAFGCATGLLPGADKKTPDEKPLTLKRFRPGKSDQDHQAIGGYGPDREAAKALYQEAEDLFRKASEQQGDERTATFLAAAAKFNQAAERLPDSALQQDALYMAGDSFFFADAYSQANEAYEKLVKAYPNNRYLDVVDQRRFTIAKYWIQRYDASPESWWAVNVSDRARPWRTRAATPCEFSTRFA